MRHLSIYQVATALLCAALGFLVLCNLVTG